MKARMPPAKASFDHELAAGLTMDFDADMPQTAAYMEIEEEKEKPVARRALPTT